MSFVDIQSPPSADTAAILLHPRDNVAIARLPLREGLTVRVGGREVTLRDPIPAGHKLALDSVNEGDAFLRYGEVIGRATQRVEPGAHVHTHNVAYGEFGLQYEFPTAEVPLPEPTRDIPTFMGYPRADGRVGTRNYVAVVAASNCAAHTAELIAWSFQGETLPENVNGVVAFPHGEGCGHSIGPDTAQLQRTLSGVLNHPNVGGAIVLGLGCEVNQIQHYLGTSNPNPDRISGLTLQESGGTRAAVAKARSVIAGMIERMREEKRQEASASKLTVALQCGGSDSFSGITANPALGRCADRLAAIGATAILSETPEIFGAEHLLLRRARSREVAERLLEVIAEYKKYLSRFGGSFDDNPSPGNKEGGLTNILEKSLGAVAKGGSSTLNQVLDYAERATSPGLVFMTAPGYDPVGMAGQAAAGATLFAFTTGRGSATGFPTIPCLKISSNTGLFHRMPDNMDLNAGRIADGTCNVDSVGLEIFDTLIRVASGERTCTERLGHNEFVPWRIGPVL